jgi:hypothetical protein
MNLLKTRLFFVGLMLALVLASWLGLERPAHSQPDCLNSCEQALKEGLQGGTSEHAYDSCVDPCLSIW